MMNLNFKMKKFIRRLEETYSEGSATVTQNRLIIAYIM